MSLFKSVENHPEEICCTECWYRGIAWGSTGREEEIIKLLEGIEDWNTNDRCDCEMCANRRAIEQTKMKRLIAFIKGENK